MFLDDEQDGTMPAAADATDETHTEEEAPAEGETPAAPEAPADM